MYYQTLFYPAQGIKDPRFLLLSIRDNPHSSARNTGLCLNMASDYLIPPTPTCLHAGAITHPRILPPLIIQEVTNAKQ